ncbi:hypothetical protein ABZT03_39195 [Streptomyces sp. NPDC005574]|uniref:hypothetical protein n=1 Tax=Streptomyces sp. NPDC005574 TaxID=3156891 RepID=UPI0033B14964
MGIRMLHRRTAQARTHAQANADALPCTPRPPVPVLAAGASTARIPAVPLARPRQAATALRTRLAPARGAVRLHAAPDWRLWADLGRGYLTLALTRLARPRPPATVTVFVAPPVPARTPGAAGIAGPRTPGPAPTGHITATPNAPADGEGPDAANRTAPAAADRDTPAAATGTAPPAADRNTPAAPNRNTPAPADPNTPAENKAGPVNGDSTRSAPVPPLPERRPTPRPDATA